MHWSILKKQLCEILVSTESKLGQLFIYYLQKVQVVCREQCIHPRDGLNLPSQSALLHYLLDAVALMHKPHDCFQINTQLQLLFHVFVWLVRLSFLTSYSKRAKLILPQTFLLKSILVSKLHKQYWCFVLEPQLFPDPRGFTSVGIISPLKKTESLFYFLFWNEICSGIWALSQQACTTWYLRMPRAFWPHTLNGRNCGFTKTPCIIRMEDLLPLLACFIVLLTGCGACRESWAFSNSITILFYKPRWIFIVFYPVSPAITGLIGTCAIFKTSRSCLRREINAFNSCILMLRDSSVWKFELPKFFKAAELIFFFFIFCDVWCLLDPDM